MHPSETAIEARIAPQVVIRWRDGQMNQGWVSHIDCPIEAFEGQVEMPGLRMENRQAQGGTAARRLARNVFEDAAHRLAMATLRRRV
jgi:hypothetical protein